jgi:16S rRNA (guanine527-N7)-methyltransferase
MIAEAGDWRRGLQRYGLDSGQLAQLAAILSELERSERAPTSVRGPREAVDAHLADSLVGLDFDELRSALAVADIGSGPGFPGTALAVALPEAQFSLIESQRRKCEFLGSLCTAARVANASVVCTRVEDWHEGEGVNDAVLARALAPQAVVLEYAAPLLRLGGALLDWRGRRDAAQERAAGVAAAQLGLALREIRHVRPFAQARDRHVHVFVKEEPTPQRFPRRAGMARKRPLAC